jgi:hypothetical protein
MTQPHLQPMLNGLFWGLSSSLLLIVAAVIASRDTPQRTIPTALVTLPISIGWTCREAIWRSHKAL